MRQHLFALLLVLPLLLLGGSTDYGAVEYFHFNRNVDTTNVYSEAPTSPNITDVYISPCAGNFANLGTPGTDQAAICVASASRDLHLVSWGICVTEPLADATEECKVTLVIDDTGSSVTGTLITATAIDLGTLNDDATCGELDGIGDCCVKSLGDTAANTVTAGGWFAANLAEGTAGAGACTNIQGIQLFGHGFFK